MSTGRFTEIADRFSVSSQAITNLKKRRKDEWDALIAGLTTADLKELAETLRLQSRLSDKENARQQLPYLRSQATAIQRLRNTFRCSAEEAERGINRFQHLQITSFSRIRGLATANL